ncbi:hypothetical protein [Ekhidna sp.]|uniref:hypothetical protein n=1 Tax=Ekhidna sp. TaxID=2608089 RepID=UPI0035117333
MKKIIFYILFLVIPGILVFFLVYRLVVTDGLTKDDYLLMVILFSLLLVRRIIQWRI